MPEYSFARAAGSAFRTQNAGGLLGGHRCSPRRPFANVPIALVPPVSDAGLQLLHRLQSFLSLKMRHFRQRSRLRAGPAASFGCRPHCGREGLVAKPGVPHGFNEEHELGRTRKVNT